MNRLQYAGGCLTLVALPFFCLAFFMFIDPLEGKTRVASLAPGLFFGSAALAPGLFLLWAGVRTRRQHEFLQAVTNLIRSHDSFTVAEMAVKIGRTELETEALVHRIDHHEAGIELVFHRPSRQYLHAGRLGQYRRVADTCPQCGAPTRREVVLPGEHVSCIYCNAVLIPPS